MNNNFVGLIILDGFGINKQEFGNAIKQAGTPNINYYAKNYPSTQLFASGKEVGLPAGQIGNSEVGHLNIGAGRVIYQSLQLINNAIEDGSFSNNTALNKVISAVLSNNSSLHLMGLVSDGGVHSHIEHLIATIKLAASRGVKNVYVHCFMDGRDTYRNSGIKYLKQLQNVLKQHQGYCISTIMGRFYAMDREKNYNRTQTAYNCMVNGTAAVETTSPLKAVEESYAKGVFDEFIEPIIVLDNGLKHTISKNDGVIFFNYREDRARQITESLVENFKKFETKKLNLKMATFTCYDKSFKKPIVAFPKQDVTVNLSQQLSKNKCKQFKIAETTKYAHVTYFMNGGIEKAYKGEDRFLIDTIKCERFDQYPNMRAKEITQKAIEEIKSNKYNFMGLNYSNCDMIGHTGNLQAAIQTVKLIDQEIKKLVDAILSINGIAVITADHGNAESMLDKKGNVLTDHTTNKVPFIVVGNNVDFKLLPNGKLSNIAPTILQLLNLKQPKEFKENSLIQY